MLRLDPFSPLLTTAIREGDCILRITPLSMLEGEPDNPNYPTYYHFDMSTWRAIRAVAVQLAHGCVGAQQKGGMQHVGEKHIWCTRLLL